MIYIICTVLAILSFLTVLNGYLDGAKKTQIGQVLSLLLLALVIVAFALTGWKSGLLAVGAVFLSAEVTRPLAARTASRVLGLSKGRAGYYVGLPPRAVRSISSEIGRLTLEYLDPKRMAAELFKVDGGNSYRRLRKAENALFNYCETQPSIQAVMREFHISRDDLAQMYKQLMLAGAGQWRCGHLVAASAPRGCPKTDDLLRKRRERPKFSRIFVT